MLLRRMGCCEMRLEGGPTGAGRVVGSVARACSFRRRLQGAAEEGGSLPPVGWMRLTGTGQCP